MGNDDHRLSLRVGRKEDPEAAGREAELDGGGDTSAATEGGAGPVGGRRRRRGSTGGRGRDGEVGGGEGPASRRLEAAAPRTKPRGGGSRRLKASRPLKIGFGNE